MMLLSECLSLTKMSVWKILLQKLMKFTSGVFCQGIGLKGKNPHGWGNSFIKEAEGTALFLLPGGDISWNRHLSIRKWDTTTE